MFFRIRMYIRSLKAECTGLRKMFGEPLLMEDNMRIKISKVLKAQIAARAEGYSDVLYLDSIHKKYTGEISLVTFL